MQSLVYSPSNNDMSKGPFDMSSLASPKYAPK